MSSYGRRRHERGDPATGRHDVASTRSRSASEQPLFRSLASDARGPARGRPAARTTALGGGSGGGKAPLQGAYWMGTGGISSTSRMRQNTPTAYRRGDSGVRSSSGGAWWKPTSTATSAA